jgi:hypothetical protein
VEYGDDFDGYRCGGITIGDIDRNGKMDIVTFHFQDFTRFRFYENDTTDSYRIRFSANETNFTTIPSLDGAYANPVIADWDKDGKNEIYIQDTHGKHFILTSAATNNFTNITPSGVKLLVTLPKVRPNGLVRSGYAGDADGDGKPDIYYNDFTARVVYDIEYQGGPVADSSSYRVYEIFSNPLTYGSLHVGGDLDGDGKGDIVVAANGNPTVNLYVLESETGTTAVERDNTIIDGYSLAQNYPNPFNPSTTIPYSIRTKSHVRLVVFDMLGREVATLVDERKEAGNYTATFDTQHSTFGILPSGVYFYRFQVQGSVGTENFVETKKMVYLR